MSRQPSSHLYGLLATLRHEGFNGVHNAQWLEGLRDAERCEGLCRMLSTGLAAWLTERGVHAFEHKVNPGSYYPTRAIRGLNDHYVTGVRDGAETFYIDLTAAQYGFDELPVIQYDIGPGQWARAVGDLSLLELRPAREDDQLTNYLGDDVPFDDLRGQALIAEVGGAVAGNALYLSNAHAQEVHISDLWVKPSMRSRGLAQALALELQRLHPRFELTRDMGGRASVQRMLADLNKQARRPPLQAKDDLAAPPTLSQPKPAQPRIID